MPNLEIVDGGALSTVGGGLRQPSRPAPISETIDEPRTWGQLGREYGAACASGAATSLMYGGLPSSVGEGAATAATGCALGMGTKLVDDLTGAVTG